MESPDAVAPQLITACPDAPDFDRTLYDFKPGVGRGAPVRSAALPLLAACLPLRVAAPAAASRPASSSACQPQPGCAAANPAYAARNAWAGRDAASRWGL